MDYGIGSHIGVGVTTVRSVSMDNKPSVSLREVLATCMQGVLTLETLAHQIDGKLFGFQPEACESNEKTTTEPSIETLTLALRERQRKVIEALEYIHGKL